MARTRLKDLGPDVPASVAAAPTVWDPVTFPEPALRAGSGASADADHIQRPRSA